MDVNVSKSNDVVIVEILEDFIDTRNLFDFADNVYPYLAKKGKIVLDLAHVNRIDSAGMGAVASTLRIIVRRGGNVKLCNLTDHVQKLFELVRLHKVIEVYPTREAAVESYQSE